MLQGKKKSDMILMLKDKGIDWEKDVEQYWRHGVYLKKFTYELEVEGKNVLRSSVCYKSFKIRFDEFYKKLLFRKYWEVTEEECKTYGIEEYKI
jgi:hypothetical protein